MSPSRPPRRAPSPVPSRPSLLAFVSLLAVGACAEPAARPDDTAEIQRALDALARAEVGADTFGLGISLQLADGRVFRADAGHADPQGATAYDGAATEQVVGSVTKLFTAVLVMQLVEAGEVALDEPLDRWFDFAGADAMSVRMLLQHTAGLPDYLSMLSLEELGRPWTPAELVARALAAERYGAPPLARAIYGNTPFVLLGRIVEIERDTSWDAAVAEHIAAPLGLEHTYYAGAPDAAERLAGGWVSTPDGWLDVLDVLDPSVGWAAGALATTNVELLRFTEALFAGELFDDPATLDAMLRFDVELDPAHLGPEPPASMGLGVRRMRADGVRLDGHLGHIHGYNAAAVRDPDTGALVVVTSNDDRAFAGPIALAVARLVRDR